MATLHKNGCAFKGGITDSRRVEIMTKKIFRFTKNIGTSFYLYYIIVRKEAPLLKEFKNICFLIWPKLVSLPVF